jgi:hypothetical protein
MPKKTAVLKLDDVCESKPVLAGDEKQEFL